MVIDTMPMQEGATQDPHLDRRLHDVGWGLLLILTGVVSLVPADRVPEGAWLLGVAVILLGVNAVRYLRHVAVSAFTVLLGLFALGAGVGRAAGVDLPLLPICLVVIGGSLVVRPWITSAKDER